jgi:hypothetical protein
VWFEMFNINIVLIKTVEFCNNFHLRARLKVGIILSRCINFKHNFSLVSPRN